MGSVKIEGWKIAAIFDKFSIILIQYDVQGLTRHIVKNIIQLMMPGWKQKFLRSLWNFGIK